jgi:hypothetical protein
LAEAGLRAVIVQGRPSLEVRRRAERLLARLPAQQDRRQRWAIMLLQEIGTLEARELLRKLAAGEPGAALTVEAQAALERLTAAASR